MDTRAFGCRRYIHSGSQVNGQLVSTERFFKCPCSWKLFQFFSGWLFLLVIFQFLLNPCIARTEWILENTTCRSSSKFSYHCMCCLVTGLSWRCHLNRQHTGCHGHRTGTQYSTAEAGWKDSGWREDGFWTSGWEGFFLWSSLSTVILVVASVL